MGLDPAMTLVYRQEYAKTLGSHKVPTVLLPQEWLANMLPQSQIVKDADPIISFPTALKRQMSQTASTFGNKSMSAWD